MRYCHKCGAVIDESKRVSFRDSCNKCASDLHSCANCRFYDTSRSNSCSAHVEEAFPGKERFNYCEEFEFKNAEGPSKPGTGENSKARESFDKLFRKK
ncbi:MAG: hypothetical protein JW803_03650 [Endomicrobiales bacterium]|nr:hypothetical protein [Endomicrobiales bacterium]